MFRDATRADIPLILAMLMDDELGAAREDSSNVVAYESAFDAIARDPNNRLLIWEDNGMAVGTLQLTFIPGLSQQGAWHMQVEAVRVHRTHRGQGIGERMMEAALKIARARHCRIVQLSSHHSRIDAQRFYRRLGFEPSHQGMKLKL